MQNKSFEEEWKEKVEKVRQSQFWRQVSSPPSGRIEPSTQKPRRHEVVVDSGWALMVEGDLTLDGPAHIGIEDLRRCLRSRFSTTLRKKPASPDAPALVFELAPDSGTPTGRWDTGFHLRVDEKNQIRVRGASELALLRASLFLSNYWSLRRALCLPAGHRRVEPAFPLLMGADLWGGFNTTQAWIHGREDDDNFLELARIGINGVPIMTLFEDYVEVDPASKFKSLANPQARANRERLSRLARQAARCGVHIFLMVYNPKLDPEHPVFAAHPGSRGAMQSDGAFRTLCSSDRTTRKFLVDSWASLFAEIPELGGLLTITGGEGFYHCFMRSRDQAADCPRCSRRSGSEVVAELVNDVARGIRAQNPDALLATWPYSAGHWSGDRDQVDYIRQLDPEHVIFQTEIDKDSVDWRPAGYAKNIWDYSMSRVTPSERCRHQRRLCRDRDLPFSTKLETNTSIECLNVPYLPAVENQRRIWENARQLRPWAIHSRWLFDGACKAPSEELGFWTVWGRNTEFADLDRVIQALAQRDFGAAAAPGVRRAWRLFSEALRHHPALHYYVGSYFIGPGQPLVLDPEAVTQPGRLDPAFYGQFYWHWETLATDDATAFAMKKPLFFYNPGFRALARRGPRRGQDVALEELQEMATLWERGARELEKAGKQVPKSCRQRFRQEWVLGKHLAYTWRSAANVEEFLRLRDTIREFSGQSWVRSGHARENVRDLDRMEEIARAELDLAQQDLSLIKGVDFLDLDLRLDMGTASTEVILKAKIQQVLNLLSTELPRWRKELLQW